MVVTLFQCVWRESAMECDNECVWSFFVTAYVPTICVAQGEIPLSLLASVFVRSEGSGDSFNTAPLLLISSGFLRV